MKCYTIVLTLSGTQTVRYDATPSSPAASATRHGNGNGWWRIRYAAPTPTSRWDGHGCHAPPSPTARSSLSRREWDDASSAASPHDARNEWYGTTTGASDALRERSTRTVQQHDGPAGPSKVLKTSAEKQCGHISLRKRWSLRFFVLENRKWNPQYSD